MRRILLTMAALLAVGSAMAQKPRPDAFPPMEAPLETKALTMATTVEEMAGWDRYPTYEVYVAMMQGYVDSFPDLCRLDTIGTSVRGRLILALSITGSADNDLVRPEMFYSSTMHGDEITGFYLMLRLCDTLLRSYGTSEAITRLLDGTRIYINPLSNPDGTYNGGNNTVGRAMRYNANRVDLNRNFPDPFGTPPMNELQPENEAMIHYVEQHHFLLSANLHGGSEVMNYPWDSFTSRERLNEHSEWWKQVCKRFVDTCRKVDPARFKDVRTSGYVNGGDWYVISNGRQDYFNDCGIRELTMELSTTKSLPTDSLNHYWQCQAQALINYIDEVHHLNDSTPPVSVLSCDVDSPFKVYPNPTRDKATVETAKGRHTVDLTRFLAGVYAIPVEGVWVKIIKL